MAAPGVHQRAVRMFRAAETTAVSVRIMPCNAMALCLRPVQAAHGQTAPHAQPRPMVLQPAVRAIAAPNAINQAIRRFAAMLVSIPQTITTIAAVAALYVIHPKSAIQQR